MAFAQPLLEALDAHPGRWDLSSFIRLGSSGTVSTWKTSTVLLRHRPPTRPALARRLGLDVRGFYRDLEWLRKFGISVVMEDGRYRLDEDAEKVIARLPFPDPQLTLGEAMRLAKGRTAAHPESSRGRSRRLSREPSLVTFFHL